MAVKRWRTEVSQPTAQALVAAGVFVAVLVLMLWGPTLLLADEVEDRSQALASARAYVAQVLPTVVLLGGLIVTFLTYQFNRFARRADRFKAAVDLLGNSESASVRCGGLLIMKSVVMEERSYWPLVEAMLCALIRERQSATEGDVGLDVQAALNVLTHRPHRELRHRLNAVNLAHVNLRGADLSHGNLGRMIFDGADLREANLTDSILVKSSFRGAKMQSVKLLGAVARGADFSDAVLFDGKLENADVAGADFNRAELAGSTLLAARNHDKAINIEKARSQPGNPLQPYLPGMGGAKP